MTKRETSAEIEQKATEWAAIMDRGNATSDDQAQLEQWLDADPRRRGAYIRARAAMRLINRAVAPLSVGASGTFEPVSRQRRLMLGGGVAAAAATLLGVTGFLYSLRAPKEFFKTEVGEVKRLPLQDGSVVVLNTASRIATRFKQHERLIELESGEGWFHVAKDQTRPFIVAAEFATVKAVGTAFSVRRRAGQIDVLVTEGIVEISSQAKRLHFQAGADASVMADGTITVRQLSADALMRRQAWQGGNISLNGDTLLAAAAEFNRYNRIKIAVDADIANETVVGWFDCNDPMAFANSVAHTFNAEVIVEDSRIRIRQSRAEKKMRDFPAESS
ncbi:MAG: FecR domain-containing protein [Steroidobacteraceae bacterium]